MTRTADYKTIRVIPLGLKCVRVRVCVCVCVYVTVCVCMRIWAGGVGRSSVLGYLKAT